MRQKPKYCRLCGAELADITIDLHEYDVETGKRRTITAWGCPKEAWHPAFHHNSIMGWYDLGAD